MRRLLFTFLLSITLSAVAHGAIAFDASSSAVWQTTSTSVSYSHTCTGSDRILIVGVGIRGLATNSPTVSGITYNGVGLTKIVDSGDTAAGGFSLRAELWYLIAPATGANNIAVTLSGAPDTRWGSAAISLTGVHQSSAIGATLAATGETGAGTTLSNNLTTNFNSSWVVDYVYHRNDIDIAEGAGQTNRLEVNNASELQAYSTEPAATTGSYTMSWTALADNARRHMIAEIKDPSAGGGGGAPRRVFTIAKVYNPFLKQ